MSDALAGLMAWSPLVLNATDPGDRRTTLEPVTFKHPVLDDWPVPRVVRPLSYGALVDERDRHDDYRLPRMEFLALPRLSEGYRTEFDGDVYGTDTTLGDAVTVHVYVGDVKVILSAMTAKNVAEFARIAKVKVAALMIAQEKRSKRAQQRLPLRLALYMRLAAHNLMSQAKQRQDVVKTHV